MKRSWIETFSESLRLIPKISDRPGWSEEFIMEGPRKLYKYPDPSEWNNFLGPSMINSSDQPGRSDILGISLNDSENVSIQLRFIVLTQWYHLRHAYSYKFC
jgi:hypothetical protein